MLYFVVISKQAYMRKLKKLKGYLKEENPACIIEGVGGDPYTIDFTKLSATNFKRAVLHDRNPDGTRNFFGVYTIYRSALNFQATLQDTALSSQFKKKTSKWLTGAKKLDAAARQAGKAKAQVGKRPMPVSLHEELLALMQGRDGTKQGK